jgi:hypothetical protein
MNKNELKEVELALSKIDEILEKSQTAEEYEDCAKLRDAKLSLQQHLDGKKERKEIKDELYFVNQKIGDLIRDALKSRSKS